MARADSGPAATASAYSDHPRVVSTEGGLGDESGVAGRRGDQGQHHHATNAAGQILSHKSTFRIGSPPSPAGRTLLYHSPTRASPPAIFPPVPGLPGFFGQHVYHDNRNGIARVFGIAGVPCAVVPRTNCALVGIPADLPKQAGPIPQILKSVQSRSFLFLFRRAGPRSRRRPLPLNPVAPAPRALNPPPRRPARRPAPRRRRTPPATAAPATG